MPASEQGRRADYRDVLNAPAHMIAEVIDGVLHTQPRPDTLHAWASSGLGARIGPPFNFGDGGPGGWWVLREPELHMGEDIVVPDWAGWRRERMPEFPDTACMTLAPDWVCEVVSPGTRRLDRYEKRPVYAREGVPHLWLLDPVVRGLEAYELYEGKWRLIASPKDDEPVNVRPFDAVTFSLGDLWP